jgi:1,2-diacylglycerol 3-alpha-glucosyltransferase
MKIAIFSDNFYPEISGISDSIIMLAKELVQMGHEVHFFGAKYSKKDFKKASMPYEELDLGEKVKVHRFWSLPMLGSPTGQSRVVIPFGLRLLKFRKEKFDIVYTQSPYGCGMEALFMSRMFGIPLIGTNHTPVTEFTRYIPLSNPLFDWIGLKFMTWYYNRCQFVTAPFAGILNEMKEYGFKRESMELSNPIDLKNFFPPTIEERKALKEKFEFTDKTVLYAGRLAPEKQVDVIIRALAEVKQTFADAMLAITGIGNAETSLQKLALELGVDDSVRFFGRVDDDTHVQTYQASEAFVVMSTAETQCISMMKAMATGIPVIGADAWALPSYIGRDEKFGYVVSVGDVETLAEKISLLLKDQEKSKQMGLAGTEYVKQFSARGVAEKWEEIFKKYKK